MCTFRMNKSNMDRTNNICTLFKIIIDTNESDTFYLVVIAEEYYLDLLIASNSILLFNCTDLFTDNIVLFYLHGKSIYCSPNNMVFFITSSLGWHFKFLLLSPLSSKNESACFFFTSGLILVFIIVVARGFDLIVFIRL